MTVLESLNAHYKINLTFQNSVATIIIANNEKIKVFFFSV